MTPSVRTPPALLAALLALMAALLTWGFAQTTAPPPTLSGPATGTVGSPLTFGVGNLLPGAPYSLDWGDGSAPESILVRANSTSASHTYTQPGGYTLRISGSGVAAKAVTISLPPCTLSLAPTPAQIGQAITASVSNLTPGRAYTLNWGPSSANVTPTGSTASATLAGGYPAAGSYPVQLSDARSGALLCQGAAVVQAPPPTLSVAPSSVAVGAPVTATLGNITPTASAPATLDWGDGTVENVTSSGNRTHTYSAPGVYTVQLSVPGRAPLTAVVTVQAIPLTLSVTPPSVEVGGTVTATPGNVPPSGAILDWGDGTSENVTSSAPRTHSYAQPGSFTVRLTAGGTTAVGVVVVRAPAQPLTLSVLPSSVAIGAPVVATFGNVPPSGASLDWGDGTVEAVSANVSRPHTYTQVGTYTVRLTADGHPPAVAVVNVSASPLTLSVAPPSVQVGAPVTATFGGVRAAGATLEWGDGSSENVSSSGTRTHSYTQPGTYTVRLTAPGQTPAVAVVVVGAQPLVLSVTPSLLRPGGEVTATVSNVAPNSSVTLDWGDGSAPTTVTAGTAGGNGQASASAKHTYLLESPDPNFPVRATTSGTTSNLAPVIVRVPPAQLTVVKVGPKNTPTTLLPTGLVLDDSAYSYTVTFSEGPDAPATSAPLVRVFSTPGTKIANLILRAPKYGISNRLMSFVSFEVPDAISDLGASSAIALTGSTVEAPNEAIVKQGGSATSQVTLKVAGSGTARLRWRLAPVAQPNTPTPPGNVLEERLVTLTSGSNTLILTLPTTTLGRSALTIEVLPAEGASTPTAKVLPAQVLSVIAADGPKTLIVGDGDGRFEFPLEKVVLSNTPNPDGTYAVQSGFALTSSLLVATNQVMNKPYRSNLGPYFEGPNGGGVDTDVVLKLDNSKPLKDQFVPLRVLLDGDTAVLKAGTFRVFVGKKVSNPVSGGVSVEERQRSLFIEALRPMALRVGDIHFGPGGATLSGATLVSPDYTAVTFKTEGGLPPLPEQEATDPLKSKIKLLAIKDMWQSGDPMLVNELGVPTNLTPAMPGLNTAELPIGPRFVASSAVTPKIKTITYDPQGKAKSGIDQAAANGVLSKPGTTLSNAFFLGEREITTLPVDLAALEKGLDALPGVVRFPSLLLYNDGDVTTPTPRGGNEASLAATPLVPESEFSGVSGGKFGVTTGGSSSGGWFGTLKMGDSGVAMLAGGANLITLDLSTSRTPTVLGGGEQGVLLGKTYGGAAQARVRVPDLGPGWQGLLWQSRNLAFSTLEGLSDEDQVGGDGENGKYLVNGFTTTVPVSFSQSGWNLDINEKLAKETPFSNGWAWNNDAVSVVILRSNLLNSTRDAVLISNLPLLGGSGRVRGSLTWSGDPAILTDFKFNTPINWSFGYGLDGTVVVVYKNFNLENNSFTVGADFDLTPSVSGLKVSCPTLVVFPSGVTAPTGACTFPSSVNLRGAALDLTSLTPSGNSLSFATQMVLGDQPAAGGGTQEGDMTVPGTLLLSSSGDDVNVYTLKNATNGGSFDLGSGMKFTVQGGEDDLRSSGAAALAFAANRSSNPEGSLSAPQTRSSGPGGFGVGPVQVSAKGALERSSSWASRSARGQGFSAQKVALPNFEFKRKGKMDPGIGVEADMSAVFGHDPIGSYWSVRMTVGNLPKPIQAGPVQIYGLTGGMAYGMSWGDFSGQGSVYKALQQDPQRSSTTFELAAGVVAGLADDTVMHLAGGLTANSDLVVQLGADLYLLTSGRGASDGFYGGGQPNARAWIKIDPSATLWLQGEFCTGPAAQMNTDKLKCDDVKPLSALGDRVSLTGRAKLGLSSSAGGPYYLYIGRYRPDGVQCAQGQTPNTDVECAKLYAPARVQAKIFKKFEANLYAMVAVNPPAADLSTWPDGVKPGSKALAFGGEMHYEYSDEGSGSVFLVCDYSWNVYFGLGGGGDVLLSTTPFVLDGQVGFWASATVGGEFCGIGGDLGADIKLSGQLHLSDDGSGNYLKGSYLGQVRMPGPIPNIKLEGDVTLNL